MAVDPALRVAIWTAVSSKPQASTEKSSLEDQESSGRAFADAIAGHVVRLYTVPGHSRDLIFWQDAEASMPAYGQLREDCEAHAFDVLFALDPDRLGRDPALSNQAISLVEKSGAEVYFASAPHPVGQATAGHRYIYAIQSVRAAEDQALRTRRSRQGRQNLIKRGLPAGQWPVGYLPLRDSRGKTIGASLDPELAPAVELATAHFLAGESYSRILLALEESTYHPPRARRWPYSSVRGMLNNDTYAGLPSWGGLTASKISPHFPAIWDEETHHQVIRERARRNGRLRHGPGSSPLAGVAFCARCSRHMTLAICKGVRRLRCSTHTRQSLTGVSCHANSLKESVVIEAVADYIQSLADDETMDAALGRDRRPLGEDLRQQLQATEGRRDELEHHRESLALNLAAGHVDVDVYRRSDDRLLADLANLEEQGEALRRQLETLPTIEAQRVVLQELIEELPDWLKRLPPERVSAALRRAGLRVEVEERQVVLIELR